MFLDNAVKVIKSKLYELMVDGIKYEKIGQLLFTTTTSPVQVSYYVLLQPAQWPVQMLKHQRLGRHCPSDIEQ